MVEGVAAAVFAATLLGGCSNAGIMYTDVAGPVVATGGQNGWSKTGKSCATTVLGLALVGDASIERAIESKARQPSLAQVAHVDYTQYTVFGIGKICTIVAFWEPPSPSQPP